MMNWDQNSKKWRKNLVNKLQERYGLTEEEAIQKTDAWLQWIAKQPGPPVQNMTVKAPAEELDQHPSSRQDALLRPSRSRSRTAGRS